MIKHQTNRLSFGLTVSRTYPNCSRAKWFSPDALDRKTNRIDLIGPMSRRRVCSGDRCDFSSCTNSIWCPDRGISYRKSICTVRYRLPIDFVGRPICLCHCFDADSANQMEMHHRQTMVCTASLQTSKSKTCQTLQNMKNQREREKENEKIIGLNLVLCSSISFDTRLTCFFSLVLEWAMLFRLCFTYTV